MLDYKLIEAIGVVIIEGGFERAARRLHITQSAVSQRVRQLEDQTGQLLLIRSSPPKLTPAGQIIMKHYQQVASLEQGVTQSLLEKKKQYTRLNIAINNDSLATWFLQAMLPLLQEKPITLDLRVDDQGQTLSALKAGEVMACLSSHDQTVRGCTLNRLGTMHYRLVANKDFFRQWFSNGVTVDSLALAPAVIFDRKDTLHHKMLRRHFRQLPPDFPCHYIPSSEQFVEYICSGLAYGAVPDIQGKEKIGRGELMEIIPNAVLPVPLYWHCWALRSALMDEFTALLIRSASVLLC